MNGLGAVHEVLAWVLIVTNAVAGAWAITAQYVDRARLSAAWGIVVVAQLSTFASAISGVVLANSEGRVLTDFHALYGFSTIITVAILYGYRRSPFVEGRRHLLYGVGSLFIMGLGLRNLAL